jgi:endonuclease V-like protein UPF0215 family
LVCTGKGFKGGLFRNVYKGIFTANQTIDGDDVGSIIEIHHKHLVQGDIVLVILLLEGFQQFNIINLESVLGRKQ